MSNYSVAGHQYILTLVDFATRYPEAVPVRKNDPEMVIDMFSRLGMPWEILSDLGTPFVFDCEDKTVASLHQPTPVCLPWGCPGLSPLELLYGRVVRGSNFILKEL